ncbi:hypothetical protein ES708_17305 [subsurface metagenome]
MPGAYQYGWDSVNKVWKKLLVDPDGSIHVVGYVDHLEDIGDVLLTALANNDILYWDAGAEKWKNIAHLGVADAHHAKYTDAEADARIAIHAAIAAAHHAVFTTTEHTAIGNAAPHHAKYTDLEAVSAMGVKGDANPLHHDKAEEWGATEHEALGDAAPHHAKYTNAEAKAAAVQAGAITNGVTKAPTHDAVYDVAVIAAAALPAVDRYDDAEAVSAMGVKGDANPLHHDKAEEWGATEHTAVGNNAPHHAQAHTLASHTTKAHSELSDAPENAHHTKFTTTEHSAIGDAAPHHTKYTNNEAVAAVKADAGLPVASITFMIGVVGTVIETGLKGDLEIPFACTINRVTMLANKSGSIVVDIWKQAYADYPPENAQSITASAPPTISGAEKSQDSTLSGWTTAIAAGDCLRYNVDSITDIEQVTISLKVTKT